MPGTGQDPHPLRAPGSSRGADPTHGQLSKVSRVDGSICSTHHRTDPCRADGWIKKKDLAPEVLLAQDQEIQQLMAQFQAGQLNGVAVQELEVMVRAAVFKSANLMVGWLLQNAADQIDAAYQPKPGQHVKGRASIQIDGMFGSFPLERDY